MQTHMYTQWTHKDKQTYPETQSRIYTLVYYGHIQKHGYTTHKHTQTDFTQSIHPRSGEAVFPSLGSERDIVVQTAVKYYMGLGY